MSQTISINLINEMNIILNDGDCSDILFENICNKLQNDGLDFTITNNGELINQNNSVVISIDQQYNSGSETLIFAPYNNTRLGYSDSLAIAMQTGLREQGIVASKILCGKKGYREDENGNVSYTVPTLTEELIDGNYDTSFVVISLGTEANDYETIADGIKSGLARQRYYLDNYDAKSDLIYRATAGESVRDVAAYFGSTTDELFKYNTIANRDVLESQTVVNPNIENMSIFSDLEEIEIENSKVRSH